MEKFQKNRSYNFLRVLRNSKTRFSVPFFYEPNYDAVIECLETCVSKERPARHPSVTYGDFLAKKILEFAEYSST